ncbi:PAS domain-containing protein, partial [Robinsoniella sp.]
MKEQISARQTARLFCSSWFEQRNAVLTTEFLADDIQFIGTGEKEFAFGKTDMANYVLTDIREIPEPFAMNLSVIHEQFYHDSIYIMTAEFTLKNSVYAWRLHGFFALCRQENRWLVCSLHFAEPGSSQRGEEHYPQTLVMENVMQQRQALLNDSLAGGMMGGYMEPGFPFYFINRRMLEYLGYENEEEFVTDIGGMITQCMHPGDRARVDDAVDIQIADKGEYVVEYRMKKKDGTYIWVHDVGRKMTAENGKPAITSVCVDITAQKQAQEEVLHIYNNIPGAVFRCHFDADFSVIDANDGLFEFIGYTREEFAQMGNKMSSVIYPDDLEVMTDRLKAQLEESNTIQNENRLLCKDGSVKWISIKAQLLTEEDNERYFYCVFVDITDEKKLQQRDKELYEKELEYFTELSSAGGGIQGRINITQDKVESYVSSSEIAIAHVGDSYEKTVYNLSASAVDTAYGEKIRDTLCREKVLADHEAGKVDYHFDFLCRSEEGSAFWCSMSFRSSMNPETGDVIIFFYMFDITEQKLQSQLLSRITELDYDIIMEIDMEQDTHRMFSLTGSEKITFSCKDGFRADIRAVAEKYMDEMPKKELLAKLDYAYIRKTLAEQDTYTFITEMKDEYGIVYVKRFQVFYISQDLGRVCIACNDATDVVRQEQKQ